MSEQTTCCICGRQTTRWLLTAESYRAVCKERCAHTPEGKKLLREPRKTPQRG